MEDDRVVAGGRKQATTVSGAPFPPGDTQHDGPARPVRSVPSAPDPQDQEEDDGDGG
jgi:hypothetical protein